MCLSYSKTKAGSVFVTHCILYSIPIMHHWLKNICRLGFLGLSSGCVHSDRHIASFTHYISCLMPVLKVRNGFLVDIYFAISMGAKCCNECVCLSVFMYVCLSTFLWPPYVIGQAVYIFILSFFFLLLFLFPRLISVVADWMSAILAHVVWP